MEFEATTFVNAVADENAKRRGKTLGIASPRRIRVAHLGLLTMCVFLMTACDTETVKYGPKKPRAVAEKVGSEKLSTVQRRIHGLVPDMVLIKGGEFLFGSPVKDDSEYDYHEFEKPQRRVRVESFYLARFLVTVEDICEFLNEVGNDEYVGCYPENSFGNIEAVSDEETNVSYRPRGQVGRSPALDVGWKGAMAYTTWLAQKTNLPLRCPTQTEWEYAARGSELRDWPWGDENPKTKRTVRSLRLTPEHGGRRKRPPRGARMGRDNTIYHLSF